MKPERNGSDYIETRKIALNTALKALRIVADRRGFTSRGLSFPFERDGQLHKQMLDAIRTAREALDETEGKNEQRAETFLKTTM